MRRTRILTAVLALAAGLIAGSPPVLAADGSPQTTLAAESYTWKNARIDGGGFVPGIVFNRKEKNLAYARTDIGGAYRWQESSKTWTPLLDSVGWADWGHTGVVSLASDSVDPNKVYAAVGTYTNSWDPGNGAVLRSADRGASWQKTDLPYKLGGNMPGRGMGERLAVDPNKDSVLYLGAPSGKGLWRSTDSGITWSQVTNFPNVGNYQQDPTDTSGYASDNQGIVWVTFDESTGTSGTATKTIYVGVADQDNAVYRSTDAGVSWTRLAGQPTGYLAHKGVLDTVNGYLYIAYSDKGGPYDGGKGRLWRYATATGTWTDISPVAEADTYYGFSGLTIDRQKPGTVMATAYSSWWPDTQIFRSTDSGGTWTKAWDYTSYPNRANRYTMDVSSSPWLTWGANPSPPEQSPKLGWMTEALEIDPFNSSRMMYGTGATIYGTENLANWDSGGQFTIKPMVQGLEETAVLDIASPPSGAPLLSALGDIGGFRHTDLTKVPSMMFTSPNFTSTTSLDYAETNPNTVVRVGNLDSGPHVAFSTDNGANWSAGTDPSGVSGGGTVAAAADGSRFVWSPAGAGVQYTTGFGTSWQASSGIPADAVVESDRVDPKTFYGFKSGKFYVSSDGGATFTGSAATGLPSGDSVRFKALPGTKGDVWLAGGASDGAYGLWHSTTSGATFTKLSGSSRPTPSVSARRRRARRTRPCTPARRSPVSGASSARRTRGRAGPASTTTHTSGVGRAGRSRVTRGCTGGSTSRRTGGGRLRRHLRHRRRGYGPHGPDRSHRPHGPHAHRCLCGDLHHHQPVVGRLPGGRQARQHGHERLVRLEPRLDVPERPDRLPAVERRLHPGGFDGDGEERGLERQRGGRFVRELRLHGQLVGVEHETGGVQAR